jgi:hypothetical protein
MLRHKGEAGLRVMQGLSALARQHPVDQLVKAAAIIEITGRSYRVKDSLCESVDKRFWIYLFTSPLL